MFRIFRFWAKLGSYPPIAYTALLLPNTRVGKYPIMSASAFGVTVKY